MIVYLIAAMAENRVIGRAGAIPWDIPADRRRFREITMGHPVIMGRRTCESIGRPLAGRTTIVLTRRLGYRPDGCLVAASLTEALALCAGADEVFVCGGGEVYREALPLAERLYLTIVAGNWPGDILFPEFGPEFAEVRREEMAGPIAWTYMVLERRRSPGPAGTGRHSGRREACLVP